MMGERTSDVRWGRLATGVALALIGFVVAWQVDGIAYRELVNKSAERADWAKALRSCGYWPTWGALGLALVLIDWRDVPRVWPRTDKWARGVLIWMSTASAGLLAELVKLVVRRERPDMADGAYVFRAFGERTWSTSGLGMPSSHTAVAFGAAWMLTRLWPSAAPVWMAFGIGCGLTRVLDRAHFVSDVYVGALVGIVAAELLWRQHARNHRRQQGVTA